MAKRKSDIERRKDNKRNKIGLDIYVTAILISSLLFITGLSLGFAVSAEKINILDNEITNMRNSIENIELQFLFLDMMSGNISCSYFIDEANRLAFESSELGSMVDMYERTQQWEDAEYIILKSRYMLVTVRDWLMIEKIKSICEGDYKTVLYFYGNDCVNCETQGFVLTYLKEKYPQKLMVYSLDTDLGVPIVDALRTSYNVSIFPSLVIDGQTYHGFTNTTDLESILDLE